MKNLDNFIYAVKTNSCTENMVVDLSPGGCGWVSTGAYDRYHAKDMKRLAQALTSGHCLPGLKIDLSANSIGNRGMQALAEGLKRNRPQKLTINLVGNGIEDKGFIAALVALKENTNTSGVKLNLSGIDPFENLTKTEFGGNRLTNKSLYALAESIKNGSLPPDCTFNLTENYFGNEGGAAILEALKSIKNSGRYLKGFQLNLARNGLEQNLMAQIADLISQINFLPKPVGILKPLVDPFLQTNETMQFVNSPVSVTNFSAINNRQAAHETPITNDQPEDRNETLILSKRQ